VSTPFGSDDPSGSGPHPRPVPADAFDPGVEFEGWGHAPDVPWWKPAFLALLVVATVSAIVVNVGGSDAVTAPTSAPETTLDPASVGCDTTSVVACVPLTRKISRGDEGEDVRRIQVRLKELGFDPGPADGVFGGDTIMAMWAFQTVVMGRTRAATVDFVPPGMWDSMRVPVTIAPRRQPGTPRHVEVYLPEQALVVFEGTKPLLVTHISSGTGEVWTEKVVIDAGEEGNENGAGPIEAMVTGTAVTPPGIYTVYKKKKGVRQSKLGTMWNPWYFNFGIAIHGAAQVPNAPASHGCIRIPIFISEYFVDMLGYANMVYVFDGVKEPEEYGTQRPPSDRILEVFPTTTVPGAATTTTVPAG
jgi:peptidoglycan hydrolase-like protein with peptidoglycan-binding domain